MINQRKNRFLPIASILVILIMLPVVFGACSCDDFSSICGTVYEWVDAPEGAAGEIYVDIDAPADREIEPIADASVEVLRYMGVTTDSQGFFSISTQYVKRRMMDIRVEKEGYETLEAEFEYTGRGHHELSILLVQEKP